MIEVGTIQTLYVVRVDAETSKDVDRVVDLAHSVQPSHRVVEAHDGCAACDPYAILGFSSLEIAQTFTNELTQSEE